MSIVLSIPCIARQSLEMSSQSVSAPGVPLSLPCIVRQLDAEAVTGDRLAGVGSRLRSLVRRADEGIPEPMAPRHNRSDEDLLELLKEFEEDQLPTSVNVDAWAGGLPSVSLENGMECAICFEDASDSCDSWRQLPCGHAFHEVCLCKLAQCANRRRCPLCRAEVTCEVTGTTQSRHSLTNRVRRSIGGFRNPFRGSVTASTVARFA